MSHVLADHRIVNLVNVSNWPDARARPRAEVALAVLGLESGFETADAAVIAEQDILGDRLVRPRRAVKRAENFIAEVTSLSTGNDLVVHVDHGIGRFRRAAHDPGGRRAARPVLEITLRRQRQALSSPVEGIELLSRYGSEESAVDLDRLGGTGWQTRKARLKKRIQEIAGDLIKVAAERQLREAPKLTVETAVYDEFCAGIPVRRDGGSAPPQSMRCSAVSARARPMDRLICGDVGFGKTEVALRAAASSPPWRASRSPWWCRWPLLARQHYKYSMSASADRRSSSPRPRGSCRRRSSPRCARALPTARSISSSARMRCSVRRSSSRISACWWWMRSSIRRRPQGASSRRAARRGARAHAHGFDAHSAHAAACADRRARIVDHRVAADRPSGDAHVHVAVRPVDRCARPCCASAIAAGQAFYVCPRIEDHRRRRRRFSTRTVPEAKVVVAHGQVPPTVWRT